MPKRAHATTLVKVGRPAPVCMRVVHIAPGPTLTLTTSAPASISARVPSAVQTLPATSGTALAGTFESPGDVKEDREGHLYKENYGMASGRAVSDRTADLDAFEAAKKGFFREGISRSRIYIREGAESVGAVLMNMITGVQSALTYVGARTLAEFSERAVVGVQTWAGYGEGTPHGAIRR